MGNLVLAHRQLLISSHLISALFMLLALLIAPTHLSLFPIIISQAIPTAILPLQILRLNLINWKMTNLLIPMVYRGLFCKLSSLSYVSLYSFYLDVLLMIAAVPQCGKLVPSPLFISRKKNLTYVTIGRFPFCAI